MSCFPSTKAWRSMTTKLQSNLQKLRRSRTLGRAATLLLWRSVATLLLRRSSQSDQSLYSYMQRKKKRKFHNRRVLHHHHHHKSFAPVYVDDLFGQDQPVVEQAFEKSTMNDRSGAGASSISSLSTVDLQAEMFIAKFREEMRLQRQRSLEMYQEMLARGV